MAVPLEPLSKPVDFAITEPDTFVLAGFNLQAGQTYGFIAAGAPDGGGTLPDPDMGIFAYDPTTGKAGDLLAYSDNVTFPDGTNSNDPIIGFVPATTGEYLVVVGGGGDTGTFQLYATPLQLPPTS
jgi:hypothetical protein